MSGEHRLKRRRLSAIIVGLATAVIASTAFANVVEAPACSRQPIINGVRHLLPLPDLVAKELQCGIANPVDLSPDTAATVNRIHHNVRMGSGLR